MKTRRAAELTEKARKLEAAWTSAADQWRDTRSEADERRERALWDRLGVVVGELSEELNDR